MGPYLIHGTHWGVMARYRDTKYSSDYEKACNIIRFTCLFHVLLISFTYFLFYVGGKLYEFLVAHVIILLLFHANLSVVS